MSHFLLSILVFLPAVGALLILMLRSHSAIRQVALITATATLAVNLLVLLNYNFHASALYRYSSDGGTIQMVQRVPWIGALNIEYLVGVDGLSLPLLLLTSVVFVLAIIASWKIDKAVKGYFVLILLLESGVLGTFVALDLFLFYVFFEFTLLPMYFLIGIWGGPRREYAAIKFFLYTLIGSVGLLIVVIGSYLYTRSLPDDVAHSLGISGGTFDLIKLASQPMRAALATVGMSAGVSKTFFLLAMVCFLIKVPAVPLHTWLPDAHVEAPTPVSMLLAAILLKLGGYGILRVALPLFPEAAKTFWMLFAIVGVVSILYGALCALSQTDFKRLVAYSSVSHMGLVTLGAAVMTPMSLNGAAFMMVAHGVVSAMLFFIVGVAYDRTHHREIARLGGLIAPMPLYSGLANIGFFANLGLPALCGFVGEVMVLLGTFQAARGGTLLTGGYATAWQLNTLAICACAGMILTAAYMLWMIQRVYLGPTRAEYQHLPDADSREISVLVPLAFLAVLLGILPFQTVLVFTEPGDGRITQARVGRMNALAATDALFVPSRADWQGSLPEIILVIGLAATLAVPLAGGRTRAAAGLTMLLTFAVSLLVTLANLSHPELIGSHFGGGMLLVDGITYCWRILLLVSSIGVTLLWLRSEEHRVGDAPEFAVLLVGATLGMSLLAQAGNLLMLLIALELTSMPSYVLAGFRKGDRGGAEASIKYVLFGAAATAVMIFCSTYLYGLFGTLDFAVMADHFHHHGVGSNLLLCIALFGLLVGMAFKLAAVPLHLWCPDTFQGASVEVAALLSIASKGAALVQLARLMHWIDLATPIAQFAHVRSVIAAMIAALAVLTMTLGNFAALGQQNLKRLLAYSSIAQTGYMLAGVAAMLLSANALPAMLAYLAVYLCMNLGAFAVAAAVQRHDGHASINELAGLSMTHPILAAAMSLCMFSFVGLPPLGGFNVKLNLMFLLITGGGAWWIVVAAIGINSAISLYYYARVVRAMYLQTGTGHTRASTVTTCLAALCGAGLLISFLFFDRLQSAMKAGGQFQTPSAQLSDAR